MIERIPLTVALVLFLMIPFKSPAEEDGVMVSLNFREAPLFQVIEFYEHFTRQTVTVERAEYPVVTIKPDKRLSRSETISSIETNLAAIGIIFTNTAKGICVYPDPLKMPPDILRVLYARATNNATMVAGPLTHVTNQIRIALTDAHQPTKSAALHQPDKPLFEISNDVVRCDFKGGTLADLLTVYRGIGGTKYQDSIIPDGNKRVSLYVGESTVEKVKRSIERVLDKIILEQTNNASQPPPAPRTRSPDRQGEP